MLSTNVSNITAKVNEIITKLIVEGYHFASMLCRGHQGEESKYIMVNERTHVMKAVWVESFYETMSTSLYGYAVKVGTQSNFSENRNVGNSIWLEKLTIEQETKFYQIGRKNRIYTTDKEAAQQAFNTSSDRLHARRTYPANSTIGALIPIPKSIVSRVRAIRGYTRTNEIRVEYDSMNYTIFAKKANGDTNAVLRYEKRHH